MAKVHLVCFVGFLVGVTGACVLVGGAGSCPSVGRAMSCGLLWSVCELSMTLGSLSANGWCCVPVLLVVCHGMSSTGACWPLGELGLSVETEISGRALTD